MLKTYRSQSTFTKEVFDYFTHLLQKGLMTNWHQNDKVSYFLVLLNAQGCKSHVKSSHSNPCKEVHWGRQELDSYIMGCRMLKRAS